MAIGWAGSGFAQLSVQIDTEAPSCFDYTDGTAAAIVQGGTQPYNYLWSTGYTGAILFGIGAGTVSVTVTDANGQSAVANATVIAPPELVASVQPENSICDGPNGNYIGGASGGTPPYIYLWSNGDRDSILETPTTGFYMLTVNDANNCKALAPLIVQDPLEVDVIVVDILCPMLCDGSAVAQVSGGVGPFTYRWNTGDTVQILDWQPPGYYEVTVTDANGCTAIGGDSIYEPPPIIVDLTLYNGNSCDSVNFPIVIYGEVLGGGTPPYTLEWSTGATVDSSLIYLPGNYWLTVTDAHNCKEVVPFTIEATGGPQANASSKNAGCTGIDDGSATVTVLGGTPPYTYLWSTGATTPDIDSLAPDIYYVTVTDANNCTDIDSTVVDSGGNIMVQVAALDTECFHDKGQVNAVPMGGTPPYTFLWNTGATTQNLDDLPPGVYTVTVTDAEGCTGVGSDEVEERGGFDLEMESDPAQCGANSGEATATPIGGVAPFTYEWDDAQNQTTQTATNLPPGTYRVKVTDARNCMATDSVMVRDTGSVKADFDWEIDTCFGDTILVRLYDRSTGNVISWQWDFGNAGTSTEQNPVIKLSSADTLVTLKVTSALNCMDSIARLVKIEPIDITIPAVDTICPNDTFQISVINNLPGSDSLIYQWSPPDFIIGNSDTSIILVSIPTDGVYWFFVNVENSAACTVRDSVKIVVAPSQPSVPADSILYTQCDSFKINFQLSGNYDPQDYIWHWGDPAHPDTTYSGPEPCYLYPDTGSYTLTLIPKKLCADTVIKIIHVGPSPEADFDFDVDICFDTICIQFTDRSVVPTVITSWQWTFSNGDTSSLQNPQICVTDTADLTATLVIEFENGCRDTITKTKDLSSGDGDNCPISQLFACPGDSVQLNPLNDSTYTYVWSPGDMLDDSTGVNPTAVLFDTTVFSVTITKNQFCRKEANVTVIVYPPILYEIVGDTVVCDSMPVPLKVNTENGTSVFWSENIHFDPVFSTSDSVNVIPGRPTTYYLRLVDTFGCEVTDSITVGNYYADIALNCPDVVCMGDEGVLSVDNNFPDDILTINWLPGGDTSATITAMPDSTTKYTVTVENQFGCQTRDSCDVRVVNLMDSVMANATPDSIFLGDTTFLSATMKSTYLYDWEPASIISEPMAADPFAIPVNQGLNIFNVLITDENDCFTEKEVSVFVFEAPLCRLPYIFVPNAFSPNDDGINDVLFVRGRKVEELYFAVYNRWGEKVFDTIDQSIGWDGTYKGERVSPDVYGYYLEVRCIGGEEYFTKGNVTVLR